MNYYTIETELSLKQRIKNAIKSFFKKETTERVYHNPLSQFIYDNPAFMAQDSIAFGLCDGFSMTLNLKDIKMDFSKPYEPIIREELIVVEFLKNGETIAKETADKEGLNLTDR